MCTGLEDKFSQKDRIGIVSDYRNLDGSKDGQKYNLYGIKQAWCVESGKLKYVWLIENEGVHSLVRKFQPSYVKISTSWICPFTNVTLSLSNWQLISMTTGTLQKFVLCTYKSISHWPLLVNDKQDLLNLWEQLNHEIPTRKNPVPCTTGISCNSLQPYPSFHLLLSFPAWSSFFS